MTRCWWPGTDPLYIRYHDEEWGRPVTDDTRLFEKVCLEGFQAGLSWITILRKREHFREAFHGFDPARVARMSSRDVTRLLTNAGIVRHRGKIESTINNAKRALALQDELGSLSTYFWRWQPSAASRPRRITRAVLTKMATTPESVALSTDLRARGWTFVGPTTIYAFMQAMGLVNDHVRRMRGPRAMLSSETPPVTTSDPAPPRNALLALNRASTTAKLMSGAAHEVNNALHVISGTVELLAEREGLPPDIGSALERIQRQTVIAAEALAGVLVFTRAQLDGQASVDMAETVTHSVALRRFAVRRAGLSIQFTPDAATPAIVRGNRGQLQQIVLNLIINAEQAMAGKPGIIAITLTTTPAAVTLRVADTGSGRPDDTMLFRPFVTGPGRTDGAGLGLWAARALAEACEGTVVLEAAQPGSVAVLTLPRAR